MLKRSVYLENLESIHSKKTKKCLFVVFFSKETVTITGTFKISSTVNCLKSIEHSFQVNANCDFYVSAKFVTLISNDCRLWWLILNGAVSQWYIFWNGTYSLFLVQVQVITFWLQHSMVLNVSRQLFLRQARKGVCMEFRKISNLLLLRWRNQTDMIIANSFSATNVHASLGFMRT